MRAIPTLNDLYTSILGDLQTEMNATISLFGKVFLRATAIVQAGKLKLFYLALGNIQKNIFVDTADSESNGGTLERFGRVKLGRNPAQAVAAKYTVQLSGSIGASIKASTTFKSDDTSLNPDMLFILDDDFVLITGTDIITVRALVSGLTSKLEISNTLTATQPIALVNSGVTVISETVQPLAAENIEDYRTATLNSYRLEAQGGAGTDYRLWSQDAQGVKAVYPYAKSGETNAENIFIEAILADSLDGKGTPTAGIIAATEAVIEFDPDTTKTLYERGRRPATVIPYYLPVTIINVDVIVNSFSDLTVDIQTLISAAITDSINLIRPFVASSDILDNKNDILDTNKIIGFILNARPGSVFGTIDLKINGVSMSSYTFINGNIPFVNSITYA